MSYECEGCKYSHLYRPQFENHQATCLNKLKCDVCQLLFHKVSYDEAHGDNCDERIIKCVFCSLEMKHGQIVSHLCICAKLDNLLPRIPHEKNEIFSDDLPSMQMTLKHMKITSHTEKHGGNTYRNGMMTIMRNKSLYFNQKIFYCSKQFDFAIFDLKRHMSWYSDAVEMYVLFPSTLNHHLKFIQGKHLNPDVLRTLNDKGKFQSWSLAETIWEHITITDIIADGMSFQFVDDKETAKKLITEIVELLHQHLNIYVSRMIIDYLLQMDTLKN
jgi:hypothetical protein